MRVGRAGAGLPRQRERRLLWWPEMPSRLTSRSRGADTCQCKHSPFSLKRLSQRGKKLLQQTKRGILLHSFLARRQLTHRVELVQSRQGSKRQPGTIWRLPRSAAKPRPENAQLHAAGRFLLAKARCPAHG